MSNACVDERNIDAEAVAWFGAEVTGNPTMIPCATSETALESTEENAHANVENSSVRGMRATQRRSVRVRCEASPPVVLFCPCENVAPLAVPVGWGRFGDMRRPGGRGRARRNRTAGVAALQSV